MAATVQVAVGGAIKNFFWFHPFFRVIARFNSDVYNTHMDSKHLIRKLKKEGWVLRATRGSHHIFTHPEHRGHISVPHPKKDLGAGLVRKLLKQANLRSE